jgi:hypothetical protein
VSGAGRASGSLRPGLKAPFRFSRARGSVERGGCVEGGGAARTRGGLWYNTRPQRGKNVCLTRHARGCVSRAVRLRLTSV